MKKFFKKLGHAFKTFFKSLWDDFKNLCKNHWLKGIGYILMCIVPIVYLLTTYLTHKPEKWALPIFVWVPLVIFILVYWFKIRTYLAIKVQAMQVENNIDAGKHAGAIIVITTLQMMMTIAPFLVGYFLFDMLEKATISVRDIFLLLTYFESAGGVFVIADTIKNVGDDELDE